MNLEEQRNRFEENWKKYAPLFGSKKWEENPDFLYFIDIPLSSNLWTEMEKITNNLKTINPNANKFWFSPQKCISHSHFLHEWGGTFKEIEFLL